jgi:hypothetical protein
MDYGKGAQFCAAQLCAAVAPQSRAAAVAAQSRAVSS